MALEGTIKDFALPDIFQLIGIQRKTGILTLKQAKDTVTIKFLEGHVVEADTVSNSLEDRLGTVLVRTGRISQEQLDHALALQRQTLQRLGHILVKQEFISQDELIDALQIQSSQIIYRLFRWREGRYHFDAVEKLDYDQSHSTPVSSETILMEGARMVDEWPIIERRLPNDKVVIRKTAVAETLDLASDSREATSAAEQDIEFDLGFELDLSQAGDAGETGSGKPDPEPGEPEIKLSHEERQVLALVDGKRAVREIADLLVLPEFETFRALSDLMTRNLVERVEPKRQVGRSTGRQESILPRLVGGLAKVALALIVVSSISAIPSNSFTPWRALDHSASAERLRLYTAMARLERIEMAVQVFYLDAGTFPRSLALLVQQGYLDATALLDPWGRPYRFAVSGGGYQIAGLDGDGDPRPGLTVTHGFSEVQRLLLEADPRPSP